MFNHLKEMMEKQREKAATDSLEASQKFGHLEEELRRKQEEERQMLAERRGEERQHDTLPPSLVNTTKYYR